MIILSICIPTYNRAEKLLATIKRILEYKGDDIEVVVLDNNSTDNTEVLLSSIQDDRFRYIKNQENIGGMPNIMSSLKYGRGEFSMLCLDKDWILSEAIAEFIKVLNKDVAFGRCTLNIYDTCENQSKIYKKGFHSLFNMGYTQEHPSGLFFKSRLIAEKSIIDRLLAAYNDFAFMPELLRAEMSMLGDSQKLSMPLIYSETGEDSGKNFSHTYINENIYFLPKKQIENFNIYIKHCASLCLSRKQYEDMVGRLYLLGLFGSTINFKKYMQTENLCNHYKLEVRHVGYMEMLKNDYNFTKNFFCTDIRMNFFRKLRPFFMHHLRLMKWTVLYYRK